MPTVTIGALLLARQVNLQFHLDVPGGEDAAGRILAAEVGEQRDEPGGMLLDVLPAGPAFPFP